MASLHPIAVLRIVQGLLGLIELGLVADVVDFHNKHGFQAPSESSFLVWCCVYTFLALLYLGLAPLFAPNLAHKYGVLAAEALAVIFWFCGWIAQAAYISKVTVCYGTVCGTARASVAFGLFSWIAWCITLYLIFRAIQGLPSEDEEEKLPDRRPSQRQHRHHRPSHSRDRDRDRDDGGEPRRHRSRKHKSHRSKSHRRRERERSPSPVESSSAATSDDARIQSASPSSDGGDTRIVEAVPNDEASRYTKYVHPAPPGAAGGVRMPSAGNYGGRI